MRTDIVKTEVYEFSELSDDAQQIAIEALSDINIDHGWWDCMFEDAQTVDIKITEFDISGRSFCHGNIEDAEATAKLILKNHGDKCETYKTAKAFLDKLAAQAAKEIIDAVPGDLEDLENDFRMSILEDYRVLLSKEFDHLSSEEAIKETIKANEYEFTADGEFYQQN